MKRFSIEGVVVAIICFLLMLFDAIFTIYVVSNGLGIELSPLMAYLIECSFGVFLSVKIIVSLIFSILVASMWGKYMIAKAAGMIGLSVYLLLALYHLISAAIFL